MRLDLLEIKDNVRLITINGEPRLINKCVRFVAEDEDGKETILKYTDDLNLHLDVPSYIKDGFDKKRASIVDGNLYIPIACLLDAHMEDKVVNNGTSVSLIKEITMTDAIGRRVTFSTLSHKITCDIRQVKECLAECGIKADDYSIAKFWSAYYVTKR